ncbi:hypothetical protein R3P38DRAFT_2833937 [Favolaschia claudopus]|uniref:Uncharacterized protein n=1 Tax=Favolaschia claudopus TaxID=2862362 RepID=A0AAW0ECW9_9AGAR
MQPRLKYWDEPSPQPDPASVPLPTLRTLAFPNDPPPVFSPTPVLLPRLLPRLLDSISPAPPRPVNAVHPTSLLPFPTLNAVSKTKSTPRIPKDSLNEDNEIVNNEFRPHVLAADRLRCWSSPFAKEHDAEFRKDFPEDVVNKTYAALFASFDPDTQSDYAAGLLRFHQFCDRHEIPERARMPASYFLLAAFIADLVGSVGGGTAWHDVNGAPWEGDHRWVELALCTANKEGTAFKHEEHDPDNLDIGKPFDVAVWALAPTAFSSCRRSCVGQKEDDKDVVLHRRRSHEIDASGLKHGRLVRYPRMKPQSCTRVHWYRPERVCMPVFFFLTVETV